MGGSPRGICLIMSGKKSLSRNQRRALQALIEFSTITKAAAECGLSEKTLSRYMRDPVFGAELAAMEAVILDEASRLLVRGQLTALTTLLDLMKNSESESTRRLAAATWLDLNMKMREHKNEARITALEEKVNNGNFRR